METQAIPKNLYILDIDNQKPTLYYQGKAYAQKLFLKILFIKTVFMLAMPEFYTRC